MWWLRLVVAASLATSLWMYLEFEILDSYSVAGWMKTGFSFFTVIGLMGLGFSKFLMLRYLVSRGNRVRSLAVASLALLSLALITSLWIVRGEVISDNEWFLLYAAASLAQALIMPALIASVIDGVDFEEWVKVIAVFYVLAHMGVLVLILASMLVSSMWFIALTAFTTSMLVLTSARLATAPAISFGALKSISIFVEELDKLLEEGGEVVEKKSVYIEILKYSIILAVIASLRIIILSETPEEEKHVALISFSLGSIAGSLVSIASAGFILAYFSSLAALALGYLDLSARSYQLALLGAGIMSAQLSLMKFILNTKPREVLRSLSITSWLAILASIPASYMIANKMIIPLLTAVALTPALTIANRLVERSRQDSWQ